MSLQSAFSIAVSGMQANATALTANASNIANTTTTGAVPGGSAPAGSPAPYQPVTTQFSAQSAAGQPGGVSASIVAANRSYVLASDPSASFADDRGMVAAPDIDIGGEMAGALMAKTAYAASAKLAKVASDMMGAAVDMGS